MRKGVGRLAALLAACILPTGAHAAPHGAAWRPIFDGRTLNGWTPKIVGRPAGDNFQQTFVVKAGAIQVSYARYDRFKAQFGHLFYKTPLTAYRLRLTYRVLGPGLPDTPGWAHSNSGVMFDSESPQSMGLDQSFPVSVEFQILGRDGDGPRPTGSVCTPGTNITISGAVAKPHCTTSSGPTIPDGTWTKLELEVRPDGTVTHRINGAVVHTYSRVELDPADADGRRLIAERGGVLAITGGYIALQSEGHPIEFKDIELQTLAPAKP